MNFKMLRNGGLIWMGILLSLTSTFSQSKYTPHIVASEQDEVLLKKFSELRPSDDSVQILQNLGELKKEFLEKGYLTADFTTRFLSDSVLIFWNIGHQYRWARLELDAHVLDFLEVKKYPDFVGRSFKSTELLLLSNKILANASNLGYPFASVQFKSANIVEGDVSLRLSLYLGPPIDFDSITYPENVKIKSHFLKSYLKLQSGNPYQENTVQAISERISQLPYVQLSDEPQLSFANHRSKIYLPLVPRRANRLDGIIGMAPANDLSNKAQLTGQLDLELHNLFQTGKSLSINWQKLRPLSQSLDLGVEYPLVLGSPIDLIFGFQLFKEDTSFIRRESNLSFVFSRNTKHKVLGSFSYKNANILSTTQFEGQDQIPSLLDTRTVQWGIGYRFNSLNDFFDPTQGASLFLSAAAGNRNLRVNPRLATEIYDQLDMQSPVFDFRMDFKKYLLTAKNQHFYLNIQAAWLESNQLFQNELYRLGGLKSVRGFSENYFYASRYAVANLEYRVRFDRESYFFGFYDQAYTFYKVPGIFNEDYPNAFGVGLNIKVSGGLLSVAYALGNSKEQNFGLSNSRIHIGFIGRF